MENTNNNTLENTNNNTFENIVIDFRNCYRKLERITNENEPVSKREWECARALYIYARDFVKTYEEAIENDNININN
jgi:hypothetical protein